MASRIAERFAGAGLAEDIKELRAEAKALAADAADRAEAQQALREMEG